MLHKRPSNVVNRPPSVPAAMWKSNDGMYTSHVSDCNKDRRKITVESVKTAILRQTKDESIPENFVIFFLENHHEKLKTSAPRSCDFGIRF